ncbi:MAG TPA: hypothetical protein ENJ33_05740 [Thiothrix sp.]|nr:hypothetical protein [Thiothrix sp.]
MKVIILLVLSIILTACSSAPVSENRAGTIKREEDKQMQMGVVTHVKQVSIVGKPSHIAHSAGRTVGSIAGGATGSGYGSIAGSIAGAFIGGVLGSSADKDLQKKAGLEITIRLTNGEKVTVTQLAETSFKAGDLVRLEMAGGKAQVVHQSDEK